MGILWIPRYGAAGGANPPPSVIFGGGNVVPSLFIAGLTLDGAATATVSDTHNGVYSPVSAAAVSGSTLAQLFTVNNTTTANSTASVSLSTNYYGQLADMQVAGFLGTPAFDPGVSPANFTGGGTSISFLAGATTQPNVLVVLDYNGGNLVSVPNGWTKLVGNYYAQLYTDAGSSVQFITTCANANYAAQIVGVYDQVSAPTSVAWL